MYKYKRIMVGLELTDEDVPAIRYASFIAKLCGVEAMYFVHVVRDLELPESLKKVFPELAPPIDESLAARMKGLVEANLEPNPSCALHYEIEEGSTVDQLLHWLRVKDIDLIIVGGLGQAEGDGSTPIEITRKAPCSVLIVPPGSPPKIEKVLVPIDFSRHSVLAVNEAVILASRLQGVSLACGHVYELPAGYFKTGKNEEEFSKIMREHARKRYSEFSRNIDFRGQQVSFFTRRDENVSRALAKAAARRETDLIVIGGRGRSAIAALVLGSVTEGLIKRVRIPVLTVKHKEEGMGILDAILEKL